MSSVSCSLNCVGASCLSLSIWIATSAVLRGGRLLLPAKITSSISAARIDLCEVSPITQRSASTRFDLPQPFGPTTPVRPGSIRKSVGSTKDLKPISRRRVSFISFQFQLQPGHGLNEPSLDDARTIGRRIGAENESAARRQQTESRTYPRLCRAEGGKNLCESTEYGKLTIARRLPARFRHAEPSDDCQRRNLPKRPAG